MLVREFRAGLNQPRRKPAGHAADRNKYTLQALPDYPWRSPQTGTLLEAYARAYG
jgi:hypothetical protein